jgi:polyphosphate kinase
MTLAFKPQTAAAEARNRGLLTTAAPVINRDLSLLEFSGRVLEEALDQHKPLLERVKFLAIFSSNIDEFFMVRVSGLKEELDSRNEVAADGLTRPELMAAIRERVIEFVSTQMRCLRDDILPELAKNGITVAKYSELSESERTAIDERFKKDIYPVLTPQAVDPTHPFPYISGGNINLALVVRPKLNRRVARALEKIGDEFFVRIKIPSFVPRFLPVEGTDGKFVLVEDVTAANIRMFAADVDPADVHQFRITRDADIALREEEADDLLATMEENLKQRRFGDVVRLEISQSMPADMAEYLAGSLEISEDDVYTIDGPLNITDAFAISQLERADLQEKAIVAEMPTVLDTDESIFEILKRQDVLLHHPYNPYRVITDLIAKAADDPDVLAIKMCLYRIGEDSPIAPLLIKASENGKQVTALIEIKARFDEANNIEWGKKLERAGVHVVYGIMGLKTHANTTLIVRREEDQLRRYVHLATGNYNPATSTIYTDLGLLTSDEKIGEDATELFNYLTVYANRDDFNKLLVAPINLRSRMIDLIQRETENAKAGKPSRIIAKINRIADNEIVHKLYEASQAGVQIDLIVRGVCTLRPGVAGMSENIRVRSIVGRLLEHSRVYYFENGGDNEIYLGSSDWMPRNLDRRVEVLAPIEDPSIKSYLKNVYLEAYLRDDKQARLLMPDGRYKRAEAANNGNYFNAQTSFERHTNIIDFGGRH